ncbi:hypothetical protein V6Z11_A07G142300 [Gossypium hirsutum]
MRIYDPDEATHQALREINIELILDAPNEDLQSLVVASTTNEWVQKNIGAFSPAVNSAIFLPAMQNIYNASVSANLDQIKVSTSVDTSLLGNSYPFSAGSFSANATTYIAPIISFLASTGAPLLANIYPAYISDPKTIDPKTIDLNYALLMAQATIDAGSVNTEIVVSEAGWPSAGETAATICNASTYYHNLVNHVNGGTPKRLGKPIETYLSAMFDENEKGPAETERHFGRFYPNKQPMYNFSFS